MSAPSPADAGVHGWLIVDKPLGLSSAGVVGRVKGMARRAGWGKVKVGHGGTLDPLATGVLPVALGEATKLCGRMLDAVKAYRFEVTFGAATATDDAEGAVVAVSEVRPLSADVEAVLGRFTGAISQRPPAYSALKVDGERAYARARAGEDVVLAERGVTVFSLALAPSLTLAAGAACPSPANAGRGKCGAQRNKGEGGCAGARDARRHLLQGYLCAFAGARYRGGAGDGRPCDHAAPHSRGAVRRGGGMDAGQVAGVVR